MFWLGKGNGPDITPVVPAYKTVVEILKLHKTLLAHKEMVREHDLKLHHWTMEMTWIMLFNGDKI